MTDPITIDLIGDRVNSAYEIFNLRTTSHGVNSLHKIGDFDRSGNVSLSKGSILWPGNQTKEPKGVFISSHLKVRTFQIFTVDWPY